MEEVQPILEEQSHMVSRCETAGIYIIKQVAIFLAYQVRKDIGHSWRERERENFLYNLVSYFLVVRGKK